MNYWIVYREQVTGKLQIDSCEDKGIAALRRRELHQNYHDVVVLNRDEVNELYLDSYKSSVRQMKNLAEKSGK